jgi:hypothetical protein
MRISRLRRDDGSGDRQGREVDRGKFVREWIKIAADWEHQSHNRLDYTQRLYLIIESLDVYSLHYTHLGTTHQTHDLRQKKTSYCFNLERRERHDVRG